MGFNKVKFIKILFVGANGRMEMEKVPDAGYEIIGLDVVGIQRSFSVSSILKNLKFPFLLLKSLKKANKIVKDFKPNILHAHYASSYGILGYLSKFKPFILSVWGSDIYHFPNKNLLNKFILRLVIKNSDKICSTSSAMKKIIEDEYKRFDVELISFGIDLEFNDI